MVATTLRSEITGRVTRVEVAPGATIGYSECVMILESMKMEFSVNSPAPATVKEILVAEGDLVTEGQPIAVLET